MSWPHHAHSTANPMMTSSNGDIFQRYWPFVWRIHRSLMNSPHKGQWRGTLMFSVICVRINDWVNNREAGDLRRYRAHNDVTVIPNPSQDTALERERELSLSLYTIENGIKSIWYYTTEVHDGVTLAAINPLRAKFLRGKNIFTFFSYWNQTGSWNPSSIRQERTWFRYS